MRIHTNKLGLKELQDVIETGRANKIKALHLCAHGVSSDNHSVFLALENDDGTANLVQDTRIAQLFNNNKNKSELPILVFLATCHSQTLGELLTQSGVSFVVCVNSKVDEELAKRFTVEFYRALIGAGLCVSDAFHNATNMAMAQINNTKTPFEQNSFVLLQADNPLTHNPFTNTDTTNNTSSLTFHGTLSNPLRFGTIQHHLLELLQGTNHNVPSLPHSVIGRGRETQRIVEGICRGHVTWIHGGRGWGKSVVGITASTWLLQRGVVSRVAFVDLRDLCKNQNEEMAAGEKVDRDKLSDTLVKLKSILTRVCGEDVAKAWVSRTVNQNKIQETSLLVLDHVDVISDVNVGLVTQLWSQTSRNSSLRLLVCASDHLTVHVTTKMEIVRSGSFKAVRIAALNPTDSASLLSLFAPRPILFEDAFPHICPRDYLLQQLRIASHLTKIQASESVVVVANAEKEKEEGVISCPEGNLEIVLPLIAALPPPSHSVTFSTNSNLIAHKLASKLKETSQVLQVYVDDCLVSVFLDMFRVVQNHSALKNCLGHPNSILQLARQLTFFPLFEIASASRGSANNTKTTTLTQLDSTSPLQVVGSPPPAPDLFVGRSDELTRVMNLLKCDETRAINVHSRGQRAIGVRAFVSHVGQLVTSSNKDVFGTKSVGVAFVHRHGPENPLAAKQNRADDQTVGVDLARAELDCLINHVVSLADSLCCDDDALSALRSAVKPDEPPQTSQHNNTTSPNDSPISPTQAFNNSTTATITTTTTLDSDITRCHRLLSFLPQLKPKTAGRSLRIVVVVCAKSMCVVDGVGSNQQGSSREIAHHGVGALVRALLAWPQPVPLIVLFPSRFAGVVGGTGGGGGGGGGGGLGKGLRAIELSKVSLNKMTFTTNDLMTNHSPQSTGIER